MKYYVDANAIAGGGQCLFQRRESMGKAFEPEQYFENPDGTLITFDEAYFRCKRQEHPTVEPFERENFRNRRGYLWKMITV